MQRLWEKGFHASCSFHYELVLVGNKVRQSKCKIIMQLCIKCNDFFNFCIVFFLSIFTHVIWERKKLNVLSNLNLIKLNFWKVAE